MGPQLSRRAHRLVLGATLAIGLLLLSACDAETERQLGHWAMPESGTTQGDHIYELWKWAWVAALITGAIVWGLIFYASWAFRRRSEDDIPVQTRYNLPLEIFYTIAPIMMVVVFFVWTVRTQDTVNEEVENPDHVIQVVGQQWSWTFNYSLDPKDLDGPVVYTAGTGSKIPTLVLEEDVVTEFKLSSPDVIHSFWITGFLFKKDVIPGQVGEERNSFQVTPKEPGDYVGKCTELCGAYHSRMLFNIKVMTKADYDAYIEQLKQDPETSADAPVLGGEHVVTQARSESEENGEHE